MKRNIFIIVIIFISFSCSLFEDENSSNKLPSGWSEVDELQGGLVSTFFTDDNRIFTGKQTYGISYSDNNAEEWVDMNNGIDEIDPEYNTTLDRRTISAFVKMNGDIYIGVETSVSVGNYEGKDYEFVGGLYKYSEDNSSWEYIGFKELDILDMIALGSKLIVGIRNGIYLIEKIDGIWTKSDIGLSGYDVNSITKIDNTIFMATKWGLHKSTDYGQNWIDIHTGPVADHYFNNVHAVDNILFAGTSNGIYISNDFGNNWSEVNSGVPKDNITGYCYVPQIVHTDSTVIATYALNTYYSGDDYPTTISNGILYTQLDEMNWNVVEFQGEEYEQSLVPYSIGIIDNKILVGISRSGYIRSTNHEVWINSTILNEN